MLSSHTHPIEWIFLSFYISLAHEHKVTQLLLLKSVTLVEIFYSTTMYTQCKFRTETKVSQNNTNYHHIWCDVTFSKVLLYSIPFKNASHKPLIWFPDLIISNYPLFIRTILSYILIEPHASDKLEARIVGKTMYIFTSYLWDDVGRTLLNYCV